MSCRMSGYTIYSPDTTVILSGESASFQLPLQMSKKTWLQWSLVQRPSPRVYNITEGVITVPNTSSEQIHVKKHQHVFNLQEEVSEKEEIAITTSHKYHISDKPATSSIASPGIHHSL